MTTAAMMRCPGISHPLIRRVVVLVVGARVEVAGEGVVSKILSDDTEGLRHQQFILRLPSGQTVLIEHNTDLAPRIDNLKQGDTVTFSGEYIWNEKGGLVHWTHHDPTNRHPAGWLKHNGRTYQ